jgi:hypothetical protein
MRLRGEQQLGDIAEDVRYGRAVVQEGGLQVLRELFGLSRNAMADLLYVSVQTYSNWEIFPEVHVTPTNAGRIGRFYRSAVNQFELLIENGIDPRQLMPLHELASVSGLPQDHLFRLYRREELECLDLGVLGLWVKR